MTALILHGREVQTVFDLLGYKENDMTYAVGWGLAHSDGLVAELLTSVFPDEEVGELKDVRLQEFVPGGGITDIEIESSRLHLVIEAKRGWNLPTLAQLAQYAPRLDGLPRSAICVLAECSPEFARRLPDEVGGVPVRYRSWKQLAQLVTMSANAGGSVDARVLGEFGDAPNRYDSAKSRKNYAGTSPITRAPGTRRVVLARFARNDRLADALYVWAFVALTASPGARTFYDTHHPASASPRQPSRRHPARLSWAPHRLRRGHRLGPTARRRSQPRRRRPSVRVEPAPTRARVDRRPSRRGRYEPAAPWSRPLGSASTYYPA